MHLKKKDWNFLLYKDCIKYQLILEHVFCYEQQLVQRYNQWFQSRSPDLEYVIIIYCRPFYFNRQLHSFVYNGYSLLKVKYFYKYSYPRLIQQRVSRYNSFEIISCIKQNKKNKKERKKKKLQLDVMNELNDKQRCKYSTNQKCLL